MYSVNKLIFYLHGISLLKEATLRILRIKYNTDNVDDKYSKYLLKIFLLSLKIFVIDSCEKSRHNTYNILN